MRRRDRQTLAVLVLVFGALVTGIMLEHPPAPKRRAFPLTPAMADLERGTTWGLSLAEPDSSTPCCPRCGAKLPNDSPFHSGAITLKIGGKVRFDGCVFCLVDAVGRAEAKETK